MIVATYDTYTNAYHWFLMVVLKGFYQISFKSKLLSIWTNVLSRSNNIDFIYTCAPIFGLPFEEYTLIYIVELKQ